MEFSTLLQLVKEYTMYYLDQGESEEVATFKAAQLAKDTLTETNDLAERLSQEVEESE